MYNVYKMKNKTILYSVFNKIVQYLQEKEEQPEEIDNDLWARIKKDIDIRKRKRKYIRLISISTAAACFLLIVWIGIEMDNQAYPDQNYIAETDISTQSPDLEKKEITLITDNSTTYEIKNNAQIAYQNGAVEIDNKSIAAKAPQSTQNTTKTLSNKLTVPKGRRTQILLSDGSRIWVNSNSKVIYPTAFAANKREIYVEGEIYIEVKHNKEWPFIVKTSQFGIQVFGTSFNVCTYRNEQEASVVLAEGHVQVTDGKNNKVDMTPNEYLSIMNGAIGTKTIVNAAEFIAWTNDLLILHDEPLEKLFQKLNRYYDVSVTYGKEVGALKISGKLDLKENIEDVLLNIASTLPVKYEIQNENINISINPKNDIP